MKKILQWLPGLLGVVVLILLVLAYVPLGSSKTHPNLDPKQAASLRAEIRNRNQEFVTSDGLTLFMRQWRPDSTVAGKEKTAVLIFHGVTAHSGPYEMAGKPFSKQGYTTFALDYRGHGLSDGPRGDYTSRERWVRDLSEAVQFVRKLGYERVIVLGHSLGVAAAIYCTKEIPDEIDGLILLSGGYKGREGVREEPSFLQKARIVSSSLLRPSVPVLEYYRSGMTGIDDPLFNFRYTLRFFRMLDMDELRLPGNLDIPVLVAVGDKDELFEVDAVREVYDDIPGSQKEFMVLPGAAHARFPVESWYSLGSWIDKSFQLAE